MSDLKTAALEYHAQPRPGKLSVELTKPTATARDLSLAYSPGVAEPVREIARDPELAYNYTGKGTIWERPNDSLDGVIDALLAEAQKVLNAIGPWDGPRPPPPQRGQWRMNFLSPAGLHFGQAAYETFAKDPMARPVIDTATALMQALVSLTVPAK